MTPVQAIVFAGVGAVMVRFTWRAIFRPMSPCRWCGGKSKVGDSERWRDTDCEHCGNTRKRMRWGARMIRGQGRGWGR